MGILTWILFGLLVGAVAKLMMPGKDPGGVIVTMLIGIAGAVLGASSDAPWVCTRPTSGGLFHGLSGLDHSAHALSRERSEPRGARTV